MTIKLTVVQRVEGLGQNGPVCGITLGQILEPNGDGFPVRLELGNLPPDVAKEFPMGRTMEIKLPTYNRVDIFEARANKPANGD